MFDIASKMLSEAIERKADRETVNALNDAKGQRTAAQNAMNAADNPTGYAKAAATAKEAQIAVDFYEKQLAANQAGATFDESGFLTAIQTEVDKTAAGAVAEIAKHLLAIDKAVAQMHSTQTAGQKLIAEMQTNFKGHNARFIECCEKAGIMPLWQNIIRDDCFQRITGQQPTIGWQHFNRGRF